MNNKCKKMEQNSLNMKYAKGRNIKYLKHLCDVIWHMDVKHER